MTKLEIIKDLERKYPRKGYLTLQEIADYRGEDRSNENLKTFVRGMQYKKEGTKKKWFVGDIADHLMNYRVLG
ncbi:MAG: hypothetical protein JJE03_07135 [Peptostreptococcaceae bacterium]|nr:hypothetical protein [Peptostreptococcaceae bacterium]